MFVDTSFGLGGEECLNRQAIATFVDHATANEKSLAHKPELSVIPGRIACWGCLIDCASDDGAKRCSIVIKRSQFLLVDQPALPYYDSALELAQDRIRDLLPTF